MKKDDVDPAILKARKLFEASGKSLDELGRAMGAEGDVARKSAWQFLNMVRDPKLGTLRRFTQAMGVSVEELVAERGKSRTGK
jgi:transcriptional regulator with XRE-family HTH domain